MEAKVIRYEELELGVAEKRVLDAALDTGSFYEEGGYSVFGYAIPSDLNLTIQQIKVILTGLEDKGIVTSSLDRSGDGEPMYWVMVGKGIDYVIVEGRYKETEGEVLVEAELEVDKNVRTITVNHDNKVTAGAEYNGYVVQPIPGKRLYGAYDAEGNILVTFGFWTNWDTMVKRIEEALSGL